MRLPFSPDPFQAAKKYCDDESRAEVKECGDEVFVLKVCIDYIYYLISLHYNRPGLSIDYDAT